MNDDCDGCCRQLDITRPVYPHAMGTLCQECFRFACALDAEVSRLRRFAEDLAEIEMQMAPTKIPSGWPN